MADFVLECGRSASSAFLANAVEEAQADLIVQARSGLLPEQAGGGRGVDAGEMRAVAALGAAAGEVGRTARKNRLRNGNGSQKEGLTSKGPPSWWSSWLLSSPGKSRQWSFALPRSTPSDRCCRRRD